MAKRIDYIDNIKGIGILFVMLQHIIQDTSNPFEKFILSFHMPIFFFASGLLINAKDAKKESLGMFVGKKIKSTIVPLFIVGCLNIIAEVAVAIYRHNSIPTGIFLSSFIQWFLIVYCLMNIAIFIIIKYVNNNVSIILITIGIFYVSLFVNTFQIISQSLIAIVYGMCGFWAYSLISELKMMREKNIWGGTAIVFLVPLIGLLSGMNEPVSMAYNEYGNIVLFYITAFCGCALIVDFSLIIHDSMIIHFLGKNSIVFYSTHFFVIRIIGAIARQIFGVENFLSYPYYFLSFLILIIVEIPLVYIILKIFPFLFGKK